MLKKMNIITVNVSDKPVSLGEHDVVCGKGRGTHEKRTANKFYRSLINAKKEFYNDSSMRVRAEIIGEITERIMSKGGRFIQPIQGSFIDDSDCLLVLTPDKVRKKISDDLRREIRRRRAKISKSMVTASEQLFALRKQTPEKRDERNSVLSSINISGRDNICTERAGEPKETDVLFGPGAPGRNHPGNKTLHQLIKLNLEIHTILKQGSRSEISGRVLQGIRHQKDGGRFLEKSPKGVWCELNDESSLERISRALSNLKHQRSEKVNSAEIDTLVV